MVVYSLMRLPQCRICLANPRTYTWECAFCLLLTLFLLYNPFLGVPSATGKTHVQHPASYRATIASSELQASRENPAESLIPALAVSLAMAPLPVNSIDAV